MTVIDRIQREGVRALAEKASARMWARIPRFWLTEIFRSLTSDKYVSSPVLNNLGVQPLRAWAAAQIQGAARQRMADVISADLRQQFDEQGYVRIDDFLPRAEFADLAIEYERAIREHPDRYTFTNGGAEFQFLKLRPNRLAGYPALRRYVSNPLLRSLAQYIQGQRVSEYEMRFVLQRVATAYDTTDPNQDLHVATFHSTAKGWLYMHDVPVDKGPLVYVPGSNKLDRWRLELEWRSSIRADGPGSWRVEPDELEARGWREVPMAAPANTLFIADTMGLHRRGDCPQGVLRDTIHFAARKSPFRVWP